MVAQSLRAVSRRPPARLDAAQDRQNLRGRNLTNRAQPFGWAGEAQEPFDLGEGPVRFRLLALLGQEFSDYRVKRVGGCVSLRRLGDLLACTGSWPFASRRLAVSRASRTSPRPVAE